MTGLACGNRHLYIPILKMLPWAVRALNLLPGADLSTDITMRKGHFWLMVLRKKLVKHMAVTTP